jgi:hypothetical protein
VLKRRSSISPIIPILLLIVIIIGLTWANYNLIRHANYWSEFASGWAGGHSWFLTGVSPYDTKITEITSGLFSSPQPQTFSPPNKFLYPLFTMIIYAPFSLGNYLTGRVMWMTFLELCTIFLALVSTWTLKWDIKLWLLGVMILLFMLSFFGVSNIIWGTLAPIVALSISGTLYLINEEQDSIAGLILSLSFIKPELSIFVIGFILVWAIAQRRFQILLGFLAGISFLFITSFILMPGWLLDWVRALVTHSRGIVDWYGSTLSHLADALPGVRLPLTLGLHAVVVLYMLIRWVGGAKKKGMLFIWTVLLTMVLSCLITYQHQIGDLVLIFPAVLMIIRFWDERWKMFGLLVSAFMCILMMIIPWLIALQPDPSFVKWYGFVLLWSIATIMGLEWIRWWVVGLHVLPLELMRQKNS